MKYTKELLGVIITGRGFNEQYKIIPSEHTCCDFALQDVATGKVYERYTDKNFETYTSEGTWIIVQPKYEIY